MKKEIIAITALAAMISCAKETALQESLFSLEASMPQTFTKTALGSKTAGAYPVLWSEGDVITVNGVQSLPLSASKAGGRTAVFLFAEPIAAPYDIRYGVSAMPPYVQRYVASGVGNGYLPMHAGTSSMTFTMSHDCCVLALTLSGSVSLSGITLSSIDGTMIADLESPSIQMTFPSGNESISGGKTFYFAVAPGMQAKGLDFEIVASGGSVMHISALQGETLEAGTVYELASSTFAANAEPVILITGYSELKTFAQRVSDGELYLKARLGADIMADATWTPLEGFKGDFDGAGYTIIGLRKAFANELTGCVRNLTLNSTITITGKDDIAGSDDIYWAGILANRLYTYAIVTNCTTKGSLTYNQWGKEARAGGIAGYAPRGTIHGCVNEASITVVGDGTSDIDAAGLVARLYSGSDEIFLHGNVNKGNVTVRGKVKNVYAGGAVGRCSAPHNLTIKDNVNAGTVSIESGTTVSGTMNVGGIAGYALDEITGCTNHGSVRMSALTSQAQNVGGIAGYVITGSVSDCLNDGSVLMDGSSAGVVRCGGILGNAAGDSTLNEITLLRCGFAGNVTIDIASHSTLYYHAYTGLYSTAIHTETGCTNTGTVTVR